MELIGTTLGKSGVLLFTIGLLIGAALPLFRNRRMALSAHLTAVQTGPMLVAAALFWPHLAVPEFWSPALQWALMLSSYVLVGGIALAGHWGASRALPIAGAGFEATASQELIVTALVKGSSVVMLLGWLTVCWFMVAAA